MLLQLALEVRELPGAFDLPLEILDSRRLIAWASFNQAARVSFWVVICVSCDVLGTALQNYRYRCDASNS